MEARARLIEMSEESHVEGEAAILTTISDDGFPHHCFLSQDEWEESETSIGLSLLSASRTARFVARRPAASFLRLIAGEAVILRLELAGAGGAMRADPSRSAFRFTIVERIVAKTPPNEKASLTGSLSFERLESREESDRRRRVKEELCP